MSLIGRVFEDMTADHKHKKTKTKKKQIRSNLADIICVKSKLQFIFYALVGFVFTKVTHFNQQNIEAKKSCFKVHNLLQSSLLFWKITRKLRHGRLMQLQFNEQMFIIMKTQRWLARRRQRCAMCQTSLRRSVYLLFKLEPQLIVWWHTGFLLRYGNKKHISHYTSGYGSLSLVENCVI